MNKEQGVPFPLLKVLTKEGASQSVLEGSSRYERSYSRGFDGRMHLYRELVAKRLCPLRTTGALELL
jgi:hypothetical protein